VTRGDCSAFVIACYSDPGLHSAREVTAKPVLGISECGVLAALTLGHRFGVIAILATSIPRHLRYLGAMGVSSRLANERAVGLQVTELADPARTRQKMIDTGRRLVEEDGAHVIVMGCAGMAQYRAPLEDALGVPVVEPTQAAPAWRWRGCCFPVDCRPVEWPPRIRLCRSASGAPLRGKRHRRFGGGPIQSGMTAVASISTLARSSISAVTCTAVIAAL
jgi:hypothetical protein